MKLTRTRKRLLGVAVVAALLGGGGAAFAATSAPAGSIFSDTSVTADHQRLDAITGIPASATYTPCTTISCPAGVPVTFVPNGSPTNVPSFSTATVTYSAVDSAFGKTLTYSIVNTVNLPSTVGLSISNSGNTGVMTVTPIPAVSTACPFVKVTNANNISATVKVTDGTAVGFETLTAVPAVQVNPGGGCGLGDFITSISVTAATDTVTLIGSNNNVTGAVDFTSTPAGAGFALANNPPGTALNGSHLAGTTAIPSTEDYTNVAVTATDAMGATAVDTFKLDVFGAVAGSDIPRLSGGHAVALNAVRENVYFVQNNSASCDHFTIVGPGQINGHEGWVPAHLGVNVAVYGGLEAHHGYTVYYQPVSGPADCSTHSTDLWPGAHWGYVYFVS